jgi:hypothetical protein
VTGGASDTASYSQLVGLGRRHTSPSWKPIYDVSIAYLNGQPYVAWAETNQAGNAPVFVKTWNGSVWTLVGSATLNRETNTGWAEKPSLAADAIAGKLYMAWTEQENLGQKAETYVNEYNSGSWSALGGTLNADPVNGSAEHISLAVLNGQPVASWGEVKSGSLRNIYLKQWNGSAWVAPESTQKPWRLCRSHDRRNRLGARRVFG